QCPRPRATARSWPRGDGTDPRTSYGDVVGTMTSEVRTTLLRFAAAVAIASFFRMYDGATLPGSIRGTHGFATRWLGVGGGGIESPVRRQRREGWLNRDHRGLLGDRDRAGVTGLRSRLS